MDCVFLVGLVIHIAKYRIKDPGGYIPIENEYQLEDAKKDLDEMKIEYTVEELDYEPHLWANGIIIEDGDNLDEKAKKIVSEGEATYYAKKELNELDGVINRATEDLYLASNITPYDSVQKVIERKNELRKIINDAKQSK